MKVTLNWLKEFVDITISPGELADMLTMAGLEVEEVYPLERSFSNVVVGKIVETNKLENADHLSICKVDTGSETVSVVCGAPNARTGLVAPLALVNGQLGGLVVERREIRGVESKGMLCSEAELGLTDRADQLMELPDDAPIGTDFNEYLGEPDVVFDIFITPNRPDCLSVLGIAREIAALTGKELKRPAINIQPRSDDVGKYMSVEIKDASRCFRYSGRYLEDIKIGPSPYWMAERLAAVGVRSINNVVDITNYVMMELGQPLHAFDYELLEGKKIIVRTAAEGEKFVTLDGAEHALDKEALLICDGKKPVALAGVMGGLNSEVQPETRRVFLESAYFEPANIRRTSKRCELSTESSRRFERGADPGGTVYAMNRAASFMVELAGATVVGDEIDQYPNRVEKKIVPLNVTNANTLLGTGLSAEEIQRILGSIELDLQRVDEDNYRVSVPTFRPDLEREVDLVEEIARLYGYNNIPMEVAPRVSQLIQPNAKVQFRSTLQQLMSSFGLRETLNLSLINKRHGKPFLPRGSDFIELLNPLSEDLTVFRPSLLVSLLTSVAYNRNRQMHDMRLFEIGNVAVKPAGGGFKKEETKLAAMLAGHRIGNNWYSKAEAFDFYDIKGLVVSLLKKLGINDYKLANAQESYFAGESASIIANGNVIGSFGKLTDDVVTLFKIKTNDLVVFELDCEALYRERKTDRQFAEIPKYPAVPFDLALLVDANIPVGDLEKSIWEHGSAFLTDVRLFDYYKGKQIDSDKKSIAFSLTFSSKERTLGENEIDEVIKNILEQLKKSFGAELRQG